MRIKSRLPSPKEARRYFSAKLAFTMGPVELSRKQRKGESVNVVDVRMPEDYAEGHIPGAISLPRGKWDNVASLSKSAVNVVYCYSQTCHLAAAAAFEWAGKGYPVVELEGGFATWKAANLSVETKVPTRPASKAANRKR